MAQLWLRLCRADKGSALPGPSSLFPPLGLPEGIAFREALGFLHFVCELRPRQPPDSRRATEERFGD